MFYLKVIERLGGRFEKQRLLKKKFGKEVYIGFLHFEGLKCLANVSYDKNGLAIIQKLYSDYHMTEEQNRAMGIDEEEVLQRILAKFLEKNNESDPHFYFRENLLKWTRLFYLGGIYMVGRFVWLYHNFDISYSDSVIYIVLVITYTVVLKKMRYKIKEMV